MRDQLKGWGSVCCFTLLAVLGVAILLPEPGLAQQPPRKAPVRKAPGKAAAAAGAETPKYKGIFEPVNYAEDLKLTDVFFVSEEEGWVSGAAGTILHTTDGGQTWTPQLGGDPQSQEYAITGLRFVDGTHGWAVQYTGGGDYKLLRTTDGETWEHVGSIFQHWSDHVFTSDTTGVQLYGDKIFFTQDAGRTWKEVFTCRLKLEVGGLIRETDCHLELAHFPLPDVGYAVSRHLPTGASAIFKTEDGGASWTVASFLPDANAKEGSIFFLDQNTGFIRAGSKLFATSDGGQTWRGLAASVGWMKFADPSVGWAFWSNNFVYTTDGGKRWSSRAIPFPARPSGFSLPRRDGGYVVGEHGMIYRYRVVPASYSNPKGIEAPAMPVVGDELTPDLAEIRESARELQTKLGSSKTGAMGGAEQPAPQGDSAPPSEFIQDCCSSEIADLETDVGSFVQDVPVATGKYRTLNLIMAGLRMASDLLSRASAMRDSFRALKSAPNREAALLALQNLLANVDSTGVTVARGFDNPPPLPDVPPQGARAPQTAAPERYAPTMATQTGQPAQASDKPTQTNTATRQPTSGEQQEAPPSLKSGAEKLKEKAKKKIKLPNPF